MEKKDRVPEIAILADAFLEALKEVRESGNVANRQTISQFLSRKPQIRDLLRLAKRTEKTSGLDGLPEPALEGDTFIRDAHELQRLIDREQDFQSRFALFLLNLCRVPENDLFYPFIDQCIVQIGEGAPLDERKALFDSMVGQIAATNKNRPAQEPGTTETPASVLDSLKENLILFLTDLQRLLGHRSQRRIVVVTRKVKACENFESVMLLRDDLLDILERYISQVNSERVKVADFIRDVGKKLIGIENEISHTFLDTGQRLKDDQAFNASLNQEIREFGETVQGSGDLNDLKNIITTRISSLAGRLDERQKQYAERLELLERDKEIIQQSMQHTIDAVLEQNRLLLEHSQKDPLTGIMNRGAFEDAFNMEMQRFQRYQEPFALIMFDLDHFKTVNDTYGHEAGDRVLVGVAKSVSQILRTTDVFARFGGEEFVVMMPYSDYSHGIVVAEKVRKTVAETQFLYEATAVPITVSVGLTVANLKDRNFDSIYRRVDRLLYEAKNMGKNRVAVDGANPDPSSN